MTDHPLADPITGAVATALRHAQQAQAIAQEQVGVMVRALEATAATLLRRHEYGLPLDSARLAALVGSLSERVTVATAARVHVRRLETLQAAIDAARAGSAP